MALDCPESFKRCCCLHFPAMLLEIPPGLIFFLVRLYVCMYIYIYNGNSWDTNIYIYIHIAMEVEWAIYDQQGDIWVCLKMRDVPFWWGTWLSLSISISISLSISLSLYKYIYIHIYIHTHNERSNFAAPNFQTNPCVFELCGIVPLIFLPFGTKSCI